MRIAVFGSGGVGGYFGARLARAGEDVTFIARGDHLQAMMRSGLRVSSLLGDFLINPVSATSDPVAVGHVDVVIVGVKAWQVPEAANVIKPLVGPATIVLPFQNGVDAASQLVAVLGSGSVIGGLCRIVSFIDGPGHIRHVGFEPFVAFGELDNHQSDRVQQLHRAFVNAGLNTQIPADINVALWNKFLFISAFSGIGALTENAAGKIRSDGHTRAQLQQAMEEVYALAYTRGIALPGNTVATTMASVDGLPEDATSSMQRDIAAGRPSELESQTGAILRMAHQCGVSVPTHELIYNALKPLEIKARAKVTDL